LLKASRETGSPEPSEFGIYRGLQARFSGGPTSSGYHGMKAVYRRMVVIAGLKRYQRALNQHEKRLAEGRGFT